MPRPIKVRTKKASATDEVHNMLDRLKAQSEERGKQILIGVVAILAIVVLASFSYINKSKQASQVQTLKSQGYASYAAIEEASDEQKAALASQALTLFNRANDMRPGAYSLYYIGLSRFALGEYEEAAADFESLVAKYPGETMFVPPALYKLGMTQIMLGKKELALETFASFKQRSITAFADLALLERARLLESMGQEEESRLAYETMLYDHPSSPFTREAKLKLEPPKDEANPFSGDTPLIFKPQEGK